MKRYKVIDAHCDTASELLDENQPLAENSRQLSLAHISGFQSYVQFFVAWVSKEEKSPFARAVRILDYIKKEIAENSDVIKEIRTAEDLDAVLAQNKHGAVLALEDGRSLEGSLSNLHTFYNKGVRAITLAWNDDNELTDGIASSRGAGLRPFGRAVVREMNRLHMMVDVSHITVKGFWDVAELSERPIMASHSNCRALCPHRRNLDNAQIKALIEKQGFIGINLFRDFLTDGAEASMSHILSHIDHILSLGGENAVGLGSDFDGMEQLPKEIHHAGDYMKLFDKMRICGYSDDLIDKITHKNMLNFIKRIEK